MSDHLTATPLFEALSKPQSVRKAMFLVFDCLDQLMSAGAFDVCDKILEEVPLDSLDDSVALAFYTVTLPAKTKLTSRVPYKERLISLWQSRGRTKEDISELLRGLD